MMENGMSRRNIILGGATVAAIAAAPEVLAAPAALDTLDTARGVVGESVSAADYIEIQQLYHRYCHALDLGPAGGLADLYTEDGEFTSGRGPGKAAEVRTPMKGREAFSKIGGMGGSRHFTSNLVVNKTPTGASASCYLLLYDVRVTPPTPPQLVEIAIYDDTLVKTAKGWRFKKRVVWRDDDDITPFKAKPLEPR
jgi:hypothetical protein